MAESVAGLVKNFIISEKKKISPFTVRKYKMSLKFVTRKLKTQKLEEQEQQQQLGQDDKLRNEQETVVTESVNVSFFYCLLKSFFLK